MHSIEVLNSLEVARLLELNRRLQKLEEKMLPLFESDRTTRLLNLSREFPGIDKWVDFEKRAEIYFHLRDDDPSFVEDSDNILTIRGINLKCLNNSFWANQDIGYNSHYLNGLGLTNASWLFYDLYQEDYGVDQPRLLLKDMARIGRIWVDVMITDQFEH